MLRPDDGGAERSRQAEPPSGAAGSGSGKSVRKCSTADLSPSIFRTPERSASSNWRPPVDQRDQRGGVGLDDRVGPLL